MNVRDRYRHIKVVSPDGSIQIPIGSKAFAYWRERTPSWIPDSAFAFHYMDERQFRNAVAVQTVKESDAAPLPEAAKELPAHLPFQLNAELRSSGLFDASDLKKAIANPDLYFKLSRERNQPFVAVGYIAISVRNKETKLLFYKKESGGEELHELFWVKIHSAYPGATLLHGGTLHLTWGRQESQGQENESLSHLYVWNSGFLYKPTLEGLPAFYSLIQLIGSELDLSPLVRINVGEQAWRAHLDSNSPLDTFLLKDLLESLRKKFSEEQKD